MLSALKKGSSCLWNIEQNNNLCSSNEERCNILAGALNQRYSDALSSIATTNEVTGNLIPLLLRHNPSILLDAKQLFTL